MKRFVCECGQRVFFDNTECGACGRLLGFDPVSLSVVSLTTQPDGTWTDPAGTSFRYCRNHFDYQVCNWLLRSAHAGQLCVGCARTEVIPALDVPGNVVLWGRLEAAKRRLLYSLINLGLATGEGKGLPRFRFLEDRRRNPEVLEDFVATGHANGMITINLAEADDVARLAVREQMQERYRTLLGHFRHECAHYYFNKLVRDAGETDNFRAYFGDERTDYAEAINRYYATPPVTDWYYRYVSTYASAHPHEDWAETFAHYLHIQDALETARVAGFAHVSKGTRPGWILEWMEMSVTLNELNRSLGKDDIYPFVLSDSIINKLIFVDLLVRQQGASAADDPGSAA